MINNCLFEFTAISPPSSSVVSIFGIVATTNVTVVGCYFRTNSKSPLSLSGYIGCVPDVLISGNVFENTYTGTTAIAFNDVYLFIGSMPFLVFFNV